MLSTKSVAMVAARSLAASDWRRFASLYVGEIWVSSGITAETTRLRASYAKLFSKVSLSRSAVESIAAGSVSNAMASQLGSSA